MDIEKKDLLVAGVAAFLGGVAVYAMKRGCSEGILAGLGDIKYSDLKAAGWPKNCKPPKTWKLDGSFPYRFLGRLAVAEQLVNDYGTGYGWDIRAATPKEISSCDKNVFVIGASGDQDTGDVWSQIRWDLKSF